MARYWIVTTGQGMLPAGTRVGEIETQGDPRTAFAASRQIREDWFFDFTLNPPPKPPKPPL